MTELNGKFTFLIVEYVKLKDEQNKRIDFRDQMIFITLGSIGAVFSFVIEKPDYITALLVLPFACIVLGWTYLINDERISEIGTYCRKELIPRIERINLDPEQNVGTNWEVFHRTSERRKERKIIQLIMDLCIFCFSAFFSLAAFFYLSKCFSIIHVVLAALQSMFILYMIYQFISYASLSED